MDVGVMLALPQFFKLCGREQRCQFHQHFTCTLFMQNCLSKLFSTYPTVWLCNCCWKEIGTKAARKMLVKLTQGVNFINILCPHFAPIFWNQKITRLNVTRKKLLNLLLYTKFALKILMKLTQVANFINVKRTNFSYKCRVLAAFSCYMYVEKRRSYKKFVRKMLMKLTQGRKLRW